jgi:ribosome assembly protein 4
MNTETPVKKVEGFKGWVLCLAVNQTNDYMVAGDSEGYVALIKCKEFSFKTQKAHKGFISSVCWEPHHSVVDNRQRFLTSSKDGTVKMWNMGLQCERSLSGHSAAVTKVLWGGQGFIYTSSEDRLIKVYKPNGSFIRDLKGHAHWVNTMALHTDYALKNGSFELGKSEKETPEEAKKRYDLKRGKVLFVYFLILG